MNMHRVRRGQNYRIISTPEDMLLRALGLRKGTEFGLVTKQPFKGPLVIKIGNRNVAVCRSIAEQIMVEEV